MPPDHAPEKRESTRRSAPVQSAQTPRDYQAIGNLVQKESDWWTIDAAYVVNKHLTLAAGYAHFGNVLNDQSNGVFGVTTKWEF